MPNLSRILSRDRGAAETTPAHQPLRASLAPLPLHMAFFASEKSKPWLDLSSSECRHSPKLSYLGAVLEAWFACRVAISSQCLLFSEARKPNAEAVGQTGAQGLVRGCGPHCPPVSRKNPARDEASGAPRAGRSSESFSGLISGVRVLSPALSGGRPGFLGG